MLTILAIAIVTVVDAYVLFFLIPRMIGSSTYIQAPVLPECFKHAGIANAISLVLHLVDVGFPVHAVYYGYIFRKKWGLNWKAVIFCLIIMMVLNWIALAAIFTVLGVGGAAT